MIISPVDCIIQARVGSTRFPEKILKNISKDKTVLEFLLNQLKFCKVINKIIIATTDLDEDKIIVNFCKDNNIEYFTGDSSNVLKRYFECAKNFHSENILRITSDCPLIDPNLIDRGIEIFSSGKYDYVTNSLEPSFPHGLDFQIFSFKTLEDVYTNALHTLKILPHSKTTSVSITGRRVLRLLMIRHMHFYSGLSIFGEFRKMLHFCYIVMSQVLHLLQFTCT